MSIQRQPSTFQRVSAWLARPEQELVRKELAWLRRWALSPGRWWVWVAAVALCGTKAFTDIPFVFAKMTGPSVYPQLGYLIYLLLPSPIGLGELALLLHLVRRRAFAPLGKGRLSDLLTTPLPREQIWPGLLAAPAAAGIVVVIASLAAGVIQMTLPGLGIGPAHDHYGTAIDRATSGISVPTAIAIRALVRLWPLILGPLPAFLSTLAIVTFVAAGTLPSVSPQRAWLTALGGHACLLWPIRFASPHIYNLVPRTFVWPAFATQLASLIILIAVALATRGSDRRRRLGEDASRPRWSRLTLLSGRELFRKLVLVAAVQYASGYLFSWGMWFLCGNPLVGYVLLDYLVYPILYACASLALLSYSLGRLRSDALWDRLRERAEREG